MSFDLKIKDGDLVISSSGDFEKVEYSDKLIQDVLKILITPINGNPFFTWYGSPLNDSLIGSYLDYVFTQNIAEQQIRNSLQILQKLQKKQLENQVVSAEEMLAAIKNVNVLMDQDPTKFNISVDILSKALKSYSPSFDLTL